MDRAQRQRSSSDSSHKAQPIQAKVADQRSADDRDSVTTTDAVPSSWSTSGGSSAVGPWHADASLMNAMGLFAQPHANGSVAAGVDLVSPSGGGQRIPAEVAAKLGGSLGADFSDVRIHVDGQAESIGAHAFAAGNNVHFAQGKYDPTSLAGQELLGHELTHVVQQRDGRVNAPATSGGSATVYQDPSLEAEADNLGARAAASEIVTSRAQAKMASGTGTHVAQGKLVVQGALPAAIVAMGAAITQSSAANAAAVAGAVMAGVSMTAQAGAAISPGTTGVQTLQLEAWSTAQDKTKLEKLIAFRLINAYVDQWIATHPNEPVTTTSSTTSTTATTSSSTTTARHGRGTTTSGMSTSTVTGDGGPAAPGGQVDQAIMSVVKTQVQSSVESALNTSRQSVDSPEFIWSDSGAATADMIGTVGAIQLVAVMGTSITETLLLGANASQIPNMHVPGTGDVINVRQFRGGRLIRGSSMAAGYGDTLAINVVGGAATKDEAANEQHGKETIGTEWTWDGNATHLNVDISIGSGGSPTITEAGRSGTPDDSTWF